MTDYAYNTGNPIGSTDVRDGVDNLKSFDVLINSTDDTYQDRLGNTVPTAKGAIKRLGPVVVGWTFTTGGTLNYPNEAALNPVDGNYYGWTGAFPKTVAPGTDPTLPGSGYVPRTDVVLRDELAVDSGASLINHGAGAVAGIFDASRPLSYYGADASALSELLTYAKTTGLPVRLTSDVSVPSAVDIDFLGAKLIIDFDGYSLLSDAECLVLRNLGVGSEIHNSSLKNVTAPWCITRWAGDNWITSSATVLASLTQTNAAGYYQPSSNDSDVWSSLPSNVQAQNISPKMRIVGSSDIKVYNPRGRFCLYEFDMCHRIDVYQPDIESGGKGTFGTILFKNLGDASYGVGNKVHGGRVAYGTFSSVCFMRNKKGGVDSGFVPYRCGESGVKTYQGEVGGRSARCYNMEFDGVYPHQTVFDGVDFCSDFGDTQVERVDDYTIAQFPWHELPTKHTIRDIIAYGCKGAGIWGDGSLNDYAEIRSELCAKSGIRNIGKFQYFNDIVAVNNNTNNAPTGEHQINIPSANAINGVRVIVESSSNIINGFSLYAPASYASDVDVSFVDNANVRTVLTKGDILAKRSSNIGDGGDNVTIGLVGRLGQLQNPIGQLGASVTYGAPGSECGDAFLKGVANGVPVHGVRASGSFGGCGVLATATAGASGGSELLNGELGFYFSGTQLKAVYKDPNGIVSNYTFTPG